MPVHLAGNAACGGFLADTNTAEKCIHIGLVNNMPDGALEATERQFLTLLGSAAKDVAVRLSLYALPDVPRGEAGRIRIARCYTGIENLWNSRLDGLIVTGAEPQAPNLTDEPYWGTLTKVFEWAEHNTHSIVFSCLAAHAAVQHIDGIRRRRLPDKRFGVFECERASDHQLTAGVPAHLRMPHSRWNDVPESELKDCGYSILTRAEDGSVDAFVKQGKSLGVFFQGHPEYEGNTLLLEYRRDVGRYLRRERDAYPSMPEGYFDRKTANLLTTLRRRAASDRSQETLDNFPAVEAVKGTPIAWYPAATRFYGNWLAYLCDQEERRLKNRRHRNRPRIARETDLIHSLPRGEEVKLAIEELPTSLPRAVTRSVNRPWSR